MARASGTNPLDNEDGRKLKGLVLAGVMSRGSIMSLDYNGNEGMREALIEVLDEKEGPPVTARRRPGRPRKGVDWAVERHRLARALDRSLRGYENVSFPDGGPLLEVLGDPDSLPGDNPIAVGSWLGEQDIGLNWVFDRVMGWYFYDGAAHRWESTRKEFLMTRLAFLLPAVAKHVASHLDKELDDEEAGERLGFALKIADSSSLTMLPSVYLGFEGKRSAAMPNFTDPDILSDYLGYLAVPAGRLELSTLILEPHALEHFTLGLTRGDFLPGADPKALAELLYEQLRPNLQPVQVDSLIAAVGAAVSGRGQRYCPIIALVGASGTGKGHVANLCLEALGRRAVKLPRSILNRPNTDINPAGADLIEAQPVLMTLDEAYSLKVAESELLTLFGDNVVGPFRRPFNPGSISGRLAGSLLVSTTALPPMNSNTGLRRRLFPILFSREEVSYAVRARGGFTQELLDAFVTLVCLEAHRVLQPGYVLPARSEEHLDSVLEDVDPVAAALEYLDEEWDGEPVAAFVRHLIDMTGVDNLNGQSLGHKVRFSRRWVSSRSPNGTRIFRLRKPDADTGVREGSNC